MGEAFLSQFSEIWQGGYYEGNPQDIMGESGYGIWGYNSALYTTYLGCIRPYVNQTTTALEIGPGRGAWSKVILSCGAKQLYAVDAAPAEHTNFWEYVGNQDRVTYLQVHDCTLADVPDGSIDYVFSFGALCHLRPEMCVAYVRALTRKMRPGANAFLQFADYDKYNWCLDNADYNSLKRILRRDPRWGFWSRMALGIAWRLDKKKMMFARPSDPPSGEHVKGAWFHWGVENAVATINGEGFEVIAPDVQALSRDPIIHFRQPPRTGQ